MTYVLIPRKNDKKAFVASAHINMHEHANADTPPCPPAILNITEFTCIANC